MLRQLNQEKATSYRCTMETNKILKKREVRADTSAPCPFAKVKEAFDSIVLLPWVELRGGSRRERNAI